MDNPVVVYNAVESTCRSPFGFPSEEEHPDTSCERELPPTESTANASGMQGIREQLVNHRVPEDIANVVMCSWRTSTQRQYDVYIKKWQAFCLQGKVDSLRPGVDDVLKFLHNFHVANRSYSLINTVRSALSSYLLGYKFQDNFSVSNHPFIVRYLKGVFNRCRPAPRYQETWNVAPVLRYLEQLFPLDKLTLKELTWKLVVLLALTSGQRCQTLTFLDTESVTRTPECYVFHIQKHVKQDRPGKLFSSMRVKKYYKEELCVYHTLQYYIDSTLPYRDGERKQLLLSYVKPYRPVGTSTVGRWIKNVLSASGIDVNKFKAHSTRAAAATKASTSLTTDEILKHVGWSKESTFQTYYNKPICTSQSQFDEAVLN